MTLRLGWFTTARGFGSRAMYETVASAIKDGEIDAELAFVFCNRDPGENEVTDQFFDLVRANQHPLVTLSSVRYRHAVGGQRSYTGGALPDWRIEYDRLAEQQLAKYPFELGVLAGYMLIFSGEFVTRHSLLNLHPALPDGPVGTWREVIRTLMRKRATESGVMLHLAIEKVDAGPIVAYCRYSLHDSMLDQLWDEIEWQINESDDGALEASALFAAVRELGLQHESPLLLATIAEIAAGRIRISQGQVLESTGSSISPADLTESVQERLARVVPRAEG